MLEAPKYPSIKSHYSKNKDAPHLIPNDYVINLLWLNRGESVWASKLVNGIQIDYEQPGVRNYDCGKFIYSCASEKELIDEFLSKAHAWQEANPDAQVIIWYDSHFITQDMLKNTQAVLNKLAQTNPFFKKIKLNDIRTIDIVKNNPDVFSNYLPFYFRVDLLKFILIIHTMKQAALFADFSVGEQRKQSHKTTQRMTKDELFTSDILKQLHTVGIQIGDDENQFIQVVNKPEVINAICVFINANLLRAVTALNIKDENERMARLSDLCEVVYRTMRSQLFTLIVGAIENTNQVKKNLMQENSKDWVKYEPTLDEKGCLPLGNYYKRGIQSDNTAKIYINGKDCGYSHDKLQLGNLDSHSYSFSRNDTDTRSGNSHFEPPQYLVPNKPSDGTHIYKCQYLNPQVKKEFTQAQPFLPQQQCYNNKAISLQKQNALLINQLNELGYDNDTIQSIKLLNNDQHNAESVAEFLIGCQNQMKVKQQETIYKEALKSDYRVLVNNFLNEGQQIHFVTEMLNAFKRDLKQSEHANIEAIDEILAEMNSKKIQQRK